MPLKTGSIKRIFPLDSARTPPCTTWWSGRLFGARPRRRRPRLSLFQEKFSSHSLVFIFYSCVWTSGISSISSSCISDFHQNLYFVQIVYESQWIPLFLSIDFMHSLYWVSFLSLFVPTPKQEQRRQAGLHLRPTKHHSGKPAEVDDLPKAKSSTRFCSVFSVHRCLNC